MNRSRLTEELKAQFLEQLREIREAREQMEAIRQSKFELPEGFKFHYPFAPSTRPAATCVCVVCGRKAQADQQISAYPNRFQPRSWLQDARTQGLRCRSCVNDSAYQPEFFNKYEVHISQDGDLPYLHVRPRERLWLERQAFEIEGEEKEAVPSEKEEAEMPKDEYMKEAPVSVGFTDKAKDHFSDAGEALGLGFQLALVNEAGDVLLDVAHEMAKDNPMIAAALESPEGREWAKLVAAFVVSGACVYYPQVVPKPEVVRKLMNRQMTASTFTLAGPRFKTIRKHLQSLAGIGERLAAIEEGGIEAAMGVQARVEDEAQEDEAEVEESKKGKKKKSA